MRVLSEEEWASTWADGALEPLRFGKKGHKTPVFHHIWKNWGMLLSKIWNVNIPTYTAFVSVPYNKYPLKQYHLSYPQVYSWSRTGESLDSTSINLNYFQGCEV